MVEPLTKFRDARLLQTTPGRQRAMSAGVGLFALIALITADELIVRVLSDSTYVELYVAYGALANLLVVVFTLAWSDKLDRHASLISAHPVEYVAGHVELGVALGMAWSAAVSPGRREYQEHLDTQARAQAADATYEVQLQEAIAKAPSPQMREVLRDGAETHESFKHATRRELPWIPIGLGKLDFLLTMAFAPVLALGLVGWLVLVVPAQYFVYLIAGAPGREAITSPKRAWVTVSRAHIDVSVAPKVLGMPEGVSESGISAKPVTLTASLAVILLFMISRLVG